MKTAILVCLLWFAFGLSAQDSANSGSSEDEGSSAAAPEYPLRQDDLQLLVGNVQRPNAMVWFDDHLYTVCNGDWTIYQIDDQTGDTITYVFGVQNGHSMLMESTEAGFDLWVPDPDSGNLWKVNQDRLAPVSALSQLAAPWGIARLDDNSLLLSDTRENSIFQVTDVGSAGSAMHSIASGLRSPTGIAVDADRIYFANGGSARRGIEWLQVHDDGSISEPRPLVSGLQNTSNIIVGADGRLYFAYALGTRAVIGRVDPAACLAEGCSADETELLIFSDIPAPVSLALSPDLRLFFHSRFRPEVYWAQLPS